MRKILPLIFAFGMFLLAAVPTLAVNSVSVPQDALFTSEVFQKFDVKLVNDVGLILPIIVAWFAVKVAYLMRGGKLENVWKLIAAGMSVLALMKVVDALEVLGILYVGGLRSVLEFLMILVFFAAFLSAYQSLVMAIRGPIPIEKPEIKVPEGEKGKGKEEKAPEEEGKK